MLRKVVKYFPEDDVPEIMIRVAQLDAIHPAALAELDELLQKQIVDIAPTPPSRVVGPQLAADIIGYFDSNVEAEVLDRLTEEDEDMGNHVRDLMFIFDNLLSVTDRDMQRLAPRGGSRKAGHCLERRVRGYARQDHQQHVIEGERHAA